MRKRLSLRVTKEASFRTCSRPLVSRYQNIDLVLSNIFRKYLLLNGLRYFASRKLRFKNGYQKPLGGLFRAVYGDNC
jgi:hypothetical protein